MFLPAGWFSYGKLRLACLSVPTFWIGGLECRRVVIQSESGPLVAGHLAKTSGSNGRNPADKPNSR